MLNRNQIQPVVLQVLPNLLTGGVERGAIDIALSLQAVGYLPLVVSNGGHMTSELERAGIEHINMPVHSKNPLVMYHNINHLVHLITTRHVNIVHARSRAPAWSALVAANRAGVSFLTTFHGIYTLGPLTIKKLYNSIMVCGDLVITVSHFVAAHICKVYSIAPERIRVVPRGVDLHRFNPELVQNNRLVTLARTWHLSRDKPLIMLPGRLTRWKGHEILIKALARLGRCDLCCLLVGPDQEHAHYRAELEKTINCNGLSDIIHIVGYCADMPAAYMLSDIVVSASTNPEAFGRVAVEAQAMGRPIVATDHGGARETVEHGKTGWLIPPGDSEALAKILSSTLVLTQEERHALAARQIAHMRAHFSQEVMCARTLAVYQELVVRYKLPPK